MTKSEQINELTEAMASAQSELRGAIKDSSNPYFKSKYADLSSVWEAWRAVGPKNGLAVMQSASAEGPRVTVTTILAHKSGQWISSALTATAKDESGQALGSILTYLRRYSMSALVGIAPLDEDDDGEAAQPRPHPAPAKPHPKPAPPPDKTQAAAETIVAQVEGKAPKPQHVVDLFNRVLRQQSPKGANGEHTTDQKTYAAKLMREAAEMFAFGKRPSQEWTPENCATLTKHFFGDKPDEQADIPF